MKLKEIQENIKEIVEKYPESVDWDVYIEDEDLYTVGKRTLQDNDYAEDLIEQNRKTIQKVKTETKMGWVFLKLPDSSAPRDEEDAFEYFKECAGGLGVVPEQKAITIHINY